MMKRATVLLPRLLRVPPLVHTRIYGLPYPALSVYQIVFSEVRLLYTLLCISSRLITEFVHSAGGQAEVKACFQPLKA